MKIKSLLLISVMMLSMFVAPSAFALADTSDSTTLDTTNMDATDVDALTQGVGQMFSLFRGFGASGETLGTVFSMMFENFENMSSTKEMDGTYVMNASITTNKTSQQQDFGSGESKKYWLPGPYNLNASNNATYEDEYPYVKVTEMGTANVTKSDGVSITFIIWDSDGTLIDAIDRLLTSIRNLNEIEATQDQYQDGEAAKAAIEEVVSAVTYFLIHINDIITGDEVIILNMIAFTSYEVSYDGYGATYEWYVTENGRRTDTITLDATYPNWNDDYTAIATELNDETALQFLHPESFRYNTTMTDFSFDVIELWLKNFEIHIDVQAILNAIMEAQNAVETGTEVSQDPFGDKAVEDIFEGLDIEFYVFTHSFVDFVMFNDTRLGLASTDNNGVPDVVREEIGTYENQTVDAISDTEVTKYFQLRDGAYTFLEPSYSNGRMEWGVHIDNFNFRLIPMGLSADSVNETDAPVLSMDYFELGFAFEPNKAQSVDTTDFIEASETVTMGAAHVKFTTEFAEWNEPSGTTDDLAIIFMSTILHVHLHIENHSMDAEGTSDDPLLAEEDYDNEQHKVKVGDYSGDLPLAEIDIAGPNYTQTDDLGVNSTYGAKTTIIPQVYADYNAQAQTTYQDENNGTNVATGMLTVEFSVLIYAISYPTFDGSGDAIVHDPTFSIFITFENPGFVAVLLVVGAVALVGIAAVLITKKKNA